jgi:hypothetical protein
MYARRPKAQEFTIKFSKIRNNFERSDFLPIYHHLLLTAQMVESNYPDRRTALACNPRSLIICTYKVA